MSIFSKERYSINQSRPDRFCSKFLNIGQINIYWIESLREVRTSNDTLSKKQFNHYVKIFHFLWSFDFQQSNWFKGEKPGLVVRAESYRLRSRGFESCRILYGWNITYSLKKEIKVAKWRAPKKYLKVPKWYNIF